MKPNVHNLRKSIERQAGFTMFEMLLSLVVLGLFSALMIPLSQSLQNRNALKQAEQVIVLAIRDAQTRALAGQNESDWGVYLETGTATVFRGNDYTDYPASYDERPYAETVVPSGETEIVFESFTGETINIGDLVLTGPDDETITLSLNTKGAVTY